MEGEVSLFVVEEKKKKRRGLYAPTRLTTRKSQRQEKNSSRTKDMGIKRDCKKKEATPFNGVIR